MLNSLLLHLRHPSLLRNRLPRRQPGLLIMGWYGQETTGDKAILASILSNNDLRGVRVFQTSYDEDYSRQTLREIGAKRVQIVSNRLVSIAKVLPEVDVVIVGGGPLMERSQMRRWLKCLTMAKLLGKKVMVYGCGLGPIRSAAEKTCIHQILALADKITVRDELSAGVARQMGFSPDRVVVTGDPALNFRLPAVGDATQAMATVEKHPDGYVYQQRAHEPIATVRAEQLAHFVQAAGHAERSQVDAPQQQNFGPAAGRATVNVPGAVSPGEWPRTRIGISIRSFPASYYERGRSSKTLEEVRSEYVAAFVGAIDHFCNDARNEIALVPMQMHADDDDRQLLRKVRERVSRPERVCLLEDYRSPAELLGHFHTFDLVIGMRLHSILFSYLAGTPAVGIDYDMRQGKVHGLMSLMDNSRYTINIAHISAPRLIELAERALSERVQLKQQIAECLTTLQERERKNSAALGELLAAAAITRIPAARIH